MRRLISLLALAANNACTPTLDPPWVLARERELAMRIEVVEQGPYGRPLDPDEPSVNEALPRDMVRATPRIAGPDGGIALGERAPQWYLCDTGSCLLRSGSVTLQPCEAGQLAPEVACALAGGDSAEFRLGDFVTEGEADALFALNRGPTVGFVAGAPGGPDTATCLANIEGRASLTGCLWMERTVSVGPLGEIVQGLEALGLEVELSESLEPLLSIPRNHNPSVRTLTVTIDGGAPAAWGSGQTVKVPVDATITVEYEPDVADLDAYEVVIDNETLSVEDQLDGRWFASREVTEFDQEGPARTVVWRATQAAPVTVHFVLGDDRRAEAWGWLDFQVR